MKRDLEALKRKTYDLLVVGGGIYGAFVAWDAALRGLSVALVERGDFGHATSANSLKFVHGGLRYLKDFNIGRARKMIREQQTWMRIAPNLIRPLPVMMPTGGSLFRSRPVMGAALKLNRVAGVGLKMYLAEPSLGRLISREDCLQAMNGHVPPGCTGAALWSDCQIENTERLLLSVIRSAHRAGACCANYLEVTAIRHHASQVRGVRVKDKLATGQEFRIGAKIVVNCSGPWVKALSRRSGDCPPLFRLSSSVAINLVVPQIFGRYAVALPQRPAAGNGSWDRSPLLFIVPWQGHSIIGTLHRPAPRDHRQNENCESEVELLTQQINTALPGIHLKRSDVTLVHRGYLPSMPNDGHTDRVKLVREGRVYAHEKWDGLRGLISVVGVKYTAARLIAEEAVGLASRMLGEKTGRCLTSTTPLYGNGVEQFQDDRGRGEESHSGGISSGLAARLVRNYGPDAEVLFSAIEEEPAMARTLGETTVAEVLHAVREEMAQTLEDVVRRRTELGSTGLPDEESLRSCADIVAGELGWDSQEKELQIQKVRACYGLSRASDPVAAPKASAQA